VIGTTLGLLGGYARGLVELLAVRSMEAIVCFPPILLALLVVTLMGPGATTLVAALTILYAPGFARVAFAATIAIRGLDYVTAQEALGARPARILVRTILPNVGAPLLVQFSLTVAAAMVLESGLSFLGLGVVPPAPSWGVMIRGARSSMDQAPWLLLWPCLALTGTILAFNLLCDRLRDVLDPRAGTQGVGWLARVGGRVLPIAARNPSPSLLSVEGLTIEVDTPNGPVRTVRDVRLSLVPGETLALVGESGSGKTLTGLALLGLLPASMRIINGRALFVDRAGRICDLAQLPESGMRRLRGSELAMVFQDPGNSLNPVHRVGHQVAESIRVHRRISRWDAAAEAEKWLKDVGLPDPHQRARAYPHELSGGQRQRAMIATAIANGPRLLVADEPTTALDVTIQAQILDLLAALKTKRDMGLIFITHNLAVVSEIADRVCVMYAGEIVEEGPVAEVFAEPRHPYTAALLASAPEGDSARLSAIPGTVPPPHALPAGCSFAPRCGQATEGCHSVKPAFVEVAPARASRCLRWREIA
jgi:peptide/nickel transport system permease protein